MHQFKPDLVIASSTYPFDTKVANSIAKQLMPNLFMKCMIYMAVNSDRGWWYVTLASVHYSDAASRRLLYRQHADKGGKLIAKAKEYMQSRVSENKFAYILMG